MFSKYSIRDFASCKKEDKTPLNLYGPPSSVGPGSLYGLQESEESHKAGRDYPTEYFLKQHNSFNENISSRIHMHILFANI
jgi:hypothetical protein